MTPPMLRQIVGRSRLHAAACHEPPRPQTRPRAGTLADFLSSKAAAAGGPAASEQRVRTLMQQLLVAVDHCHRLGIALYNMRVRARLCG